MQPKRCPRPVPFAAAVLLALLAGCAGFAPPLATTGAGRAQTAARNGDHAQAAAQYEALAAASSGADQAELQLSAAREWLAANRVADAQRVLAAMTAAANPQQQLRRRLLQAQAALTANHAAEAWRRISAIGTPADPQLALRYEDLRMRIALAANRPVDGVRAEIDAERFVTTPQQRTQLRSQLLDQLLQARGRGIKLEPAASRDPLIRGWLELGATATTSASLTGATAAARWRARYPDHPATQLLSRAFPSALPATAISGRIALLLPLSGRTAAAASTVRDGFLSAYYQLPANGRPDLRIYDTATLPAAQAVTQARADGSSFIVGPLTRESVAAVAQLGPEPVPLLALNFLPSDGAAPFGMYQFALSPEEEARQIAQRVLADGHRRGVALVPADDWGRRVLAAFTAEFNRDGGTLVSQASYDPAEHDYSTPISTVLRISESQARHERLERVLGTKLNYQPRIRGDIEFIFAPAPSINARLLLPQLRYFYAGELPVYSTSDAYVPDNVDSNQDLNGLIYPDMPWMVGDDASLQDVRQSVQAAWDGKAAWRSRLFAFGYDACQLYLAMQQAPRNPAGARVSGLTGQLSFDADRRVQRQLLWVQVRNGQPRLIGAAGAAGAAGTNATTTTGATP